MYINIYIYIYIYICILYTFLYAHKYLYTYICMYTVYRNAIFKHLFLFCYITLINKHAYKRIYTQIMLQKLRKTPLSLDMICSQPSCPVCNEDYHISGMITQLPCSHFFHDACLMPWLDAKKTCPICRYICICV
jgi:hypothetical protein